MGAGKGQGGCGLGTADGGWRVGVLKVWDSYDKMYLARSGTIVHPVWSNSPFRPLDIAPLLPDRAGGAFRGALVERQRTQGAPKDDQEKAHL